MWTQVMMGVALVQGGTGVSPRHLGFGREALPSPTSGPNSLCDLNKSLSISGPVSSPV